MKPGKPGPLLLLLRPGRSSPQRGPGAAENALPRALLCGDFSIEAEVGSLRGCDCSWQTLRPPDYPGCKRPSMVAQEQRGGKKGQVNEAGVGPRSQEVFHEDGVEKCPTLQKEDTLSVQWHRETSEAPPKFLSSSTSSDSSSPSPHLLRHPHSAGVCTVGQNT